MSQQIARDLQPGETVAVTVKGATFRFESEGKLYFDLPDGSMTVISRYDGLKVARVSPADGLPSPGETWADRDNNIYFAVGNETADYFMASNGNKVLWRVLNETAGPLRLVAEAVTFTADELAGIADDGEQSGALS